MSLDGLRAWIGEVESKLGMRTRVFLALSVIAIGIGGAAIYLAIDARDSSVSESDVQELQQELEAQIEAGGSAAATAEVAQLEAELAALEQRVEQLEGKGGSGTQGGSANDGASIPPGSLESAQSGAEVEKLRKEAEGVTGQGDAAE